MCQKEVCHYAVNIIYGGLFGGRTGDSAAKGLCSLRRCGRAFGCKKPSVSRAVKELSKKKCLIKKDDGTLSLTEQGQQIAQQIYEKHQFFTRQLIEAGVPQDIAAQDACKLEHVISEISFKKLKEAVWMNAREVIPSEK